MTFLPLLNEVAKSVLEVKSVASYKEDRVNIPNNNALLSFAPHLVQVAAAVGVDLDEAEYTFTVAKNKEGGFSAYQPFVAARDGKAVIVWGKSNIELSTIANLTLEQEKEKPIFVVEVGDDMYKFPIMFPKDAKVDYSTAKKAFRNGTLVDFLSKGFEKGQKLSTLTPGDYNIVAIRENNFKGEKNYEIFIEGLSWFKTNAKIRRKIEAGLTVSEAEPALLTCHGEVGKTSTGHPIIGVDILSKIELDLPEFVF